jgi:hypothetical protein
VDADTKTGINVPGFSFVFHIPLDKSGFVSSAFGLTFSRVNDFNRSVRYHGTNDDTSIIDYFIDDAFGAPTSQFDGAKYNTPTGLAYYNYLIGPTDLLDPSFPDDEYFTDVVTVPDQAEEIQTSRATNQWTFAYGANYKDVLFLGASVGIMSLKYEASKHYTEEFDDPYLNYLALDEALNIKGSGVNITLGTVIRPINFVQIGLSFSSPTFYTLGEEYEASMNTSWKDFDYYGTGETILGEESAATDLVATDYLLTTPLKFGVGLTLISKFGFISGDVEFVNPSKAKYSSEVPGISFDGENDGIKNAYQSVVNYRVGAEFRYEKFRVRAGYSLQGSAYNKNFDLDNSIKSLSGGVGVRLERFFADFALIQYSGSMYYQPYRLFDGSGSIATLDNKTITGLLTLGFTF